MPEPAGLAERMGVSTARSLMALRKSGVSSGVRRAAEAAGRRIASGRLVGLLGERPEMDKQMEQTGMRNGEMKAHRVARMGDTKKERARWTAVSA